MLEMMVAECDDAGVGKMDGVGVGRRRLMVWRMLTVERVETGLRHENDSSTVQIRLSCSLTLHIP